MSENLIILLGPSGVGKTTISEKLEKLLRLKNVISSTTRPRRPNEIDGRDYHFYDREEFELRKERGEFLEYAPYRGHLYGTRYEDLNNAIDSGGLVLLIVEINGAREIVRSYRRAQTFFLEAPIEDLKRRLGEREMDDNKRRERIDALGDELLYAKDPCIRDVILNPDGHLDEAIEEICGIIERRTRHPIGRT